jgi:RES domain-containing protein
VIADLKAIHFAAALQVAPPRRFAATVVTRFVFERFRSTMTSTAGARGYGGRWNPQGIGALYTSFERETALAEFTRGIAVDQPLPVAVMGSLIVNVEQAADFTDIRFCRALGVSFADLTGGFSNADYHITQHLGALSYQHPVDAMVVPSAIRRGSSNLVIFNNHKSTSKAVVTAIR